MEPTTMVLVRHGHMADNDVGPAARLRGWTDPPLTKRGMLQAHALAQRLADEPTASALYTSPLVRARQTADVIGSALGLRPRSRVGLREISCGLVDGWLISRVQRRYPELWERNLAQNDDGFHWPGGETYQAFRRRVLRALQSIKHAHPGERVVVVTHAGAVAQVIGALNGLGAAQWSAFRPSNASLTELRWQHQTVSVVRFDERVHVPSEAATSAIPDRRAG
jgi:broad specificity phosphatase PhoE